MDPVVSNVILGQCSKMLRTKLKGNTTFSAIQNDGRVGALFKLIKRIYRKIHVNALIYDVSDESKRIFYLYI